MSKLAEIGVVILAAGQSSRLGRPKQLVHFQGKPLLQHTLDAVSSLAFTAKVLVLGANDKSILNSTDVGSFVVVNNKAWAEGIGSSIRVGTNEVTSNPDVEHLLFLLSDQPFISAAFISKLVERHSGIGITASRYREQIGVPAIFSKTYCKELLELKGDHGAKKVIKKFLSQTILIDFEMGYFDVDTPEDLVKLEEFTKEQLK